MAVLWPLLLSEMPLLPLGDLGDDRAGTQLINGVYVYFVNSSDNVLSQ